VETAHAREARAPRMFLLLNGSALLFAVVLGAVVWALESGAF
jgi:nitrogen fixation-related uncharacterized protein